jgi:hypothetical protein
VESGLLAPSACDLCDSPYLGSPGLKLSRGRRTLEGPRDPVLFARPRLCEEHWAGNAADEGPKEAARARRRTSRRTCRLCGTGPDSRGGLLYARRSAPIGVPVAQRIERPPSKRQVVGSIPTGDAKPMQWRRACVRGVEGRRDRRVVEGRCRCGYVRHELESKDGSSCKLRPIRRPIEREITTLGCRGSTLPNDSRVQHPAPDLAPIATCRP